MRLILIDLKKARKKNLKTSNSILFHRLLMIIISFVVFYGFSFRFASAFSLLTLCYCVSLCSIWVFSELIYFSAWSSLGFLFAFFSITQRRLQVRPSPRTFHFFLFIVLTALLTVSHVASDSATLCSLFTYILKSTIDFEIERQNRMSFSSCWAWEICLHSIGWGNVKPWNDLSSAQASKFTGRRERWILLMLLSAEFCSISDKT